MHILLTGATGFIGSAIQTELLKAGHTIKPISRQQGFDFNRLTNANDWLSLLDNVDAVINAVGIIAETRQQSFKVLHTQTPIALFQACQTKNIKRVIHISALGADENAITPYHLTKRAADEYLQTTELDWFILRPSLVYGTGGASDQLFKRLARLPIWILPDGGKQLVQPVSVSDVVATIIKALSAEPTPQILNVVGPNVYSFADWLTVLRKTQTASKAKIINAPMPLVYSIAKLVHPLIPLLNPDNLIMLQQGNTSDIKPLAEFLGYMPKSFEDSV